MRDASAGFPGLAALVPLAALSELAGDERVVSTNTAWKLVTGTTFAEPVPAAAALPSPAAHTIVTAPTTATALVIRDAWPRSWPA